MKRLMIVLFLFGVFVACSKHDDPLPQLPVVEPPIPKNFTVTSPSAGIYDLSWTIDDPAVVSYYQIYYFDVILGPVPWDTTATTSTQINLGAPLGGIIWGVSSITIQNVEGSIVYASAGMPK